MPLMMVVSGGFGCWWHVFPVLLCAVTMMLVVLLDFNSDDGTKLCCMCDFSGVLFVEFQWYFVVIVMY